MCFSSPFGDGGAIVGSAERRGGMRWKRCGETENRLSGWRHYIVSLEGRAPCL